MQKIEIFNEDCLNTLKRIEDKSIDLILQDPPYNTTANEWDVKIDLNTFWNEWNRIIKPKGAIVFTCNQPFTTKLIYSNIKNFKYEWVWVKTRKTNYVNAKNRPMGNHESIVVFSLGTIANGSENRMIYNPIGIKKSSKIRQITDVTHGNNIGYRANQIGRVYNVENENYPTTVLYFDSCENSNHPTEKPIDLMRYLIKTYTNENEIIFDGFSGSGTTAHACLKENRNFIGAEINKEYYDYSIKRIELERSQFRLSL